MTTSDPITPEQLAEWRALADAATEGPWWTGMHDGFSFTVEGPQADSHPVAQRLVQPDTAFIAASREAVPALLAEVERLRAAGPALFEETLNAVMRRAETAETAETAEARVAQYEQVTSALIQVGQSGGYAPPEFSAQWRARAETAEAKVAAVNAVLDKPIRPYADERIPLVPQRKFLREAYGDLIVDELEAALTTTGQEQGNG